MPFNPKHVYKTPEQQEEERIESKRKKHEEIAELLGYKEAQKERLKAERKADLEAVAKRKKGKK